MNPPLPPRFTPLVGEDGRLRDEATGREAWLDVATGDCAGLALHLRHEQRARLGHPQVAAALAAGRSTDGHWWAIREGVQPLGTGSIAPTDLAAWLPGWLAGLGALHAAGLVHGALDPASFALDAAGRPRLVDLGCALRIGQMAEGPPQADARPFAAPERLAEGRLDARTDLFAVGALLYWWLTGVAPSGCPALSDEAIAALPAPWDAIVDALLQPAPAGRPASVAEALALLAPSLPNSVPAGLPLRQVAPLVGRRTELNRLLALADEVADVGAGRVVAVSGPAGAGKSRLMAELRHRLISRGWTALVGRPDARLAGAPYGAWGGILTRLLATAAPATAAEAAPMLAAVLPGLKAGPVAALEPRAEMLRLCRTIAGLIEEAAATAPLVLCLEDWQDADPASRELLAYLDRAMPAIPYYVVLASRDTHGLPPGELLALGPLGGDDARTAWEGGFHDPGARRGDRPLPCGWDPVLNEAGGNPGMLDTLADACATATLAGGTADAVLAVLAPARTLPAVWRRRLAAASPAARILARAAAVAGPGAGLGLLGTIAGSALAEPAALLQAAEELGALGAFVAEGAGFTLVAPSDAIPREDDDAPADVGAATWAQASAHARALAYWRAAAQLGADVPPAQFARHALLAEDTGAAAWFATAAARAALRVYGLEEAESWIAAATAREAALTDSLASGRLDLAEARGDLARFRARGAEAEAAYDVALALAETEAPSRVAYLRTSLGIALNLVSRGEEAGWLFGTAAADERATEAARMRAMTACARHAVRHGRPEQAIALCRVVVDAPGALPLHRGEALGLLGLICATTPGQSVDEGLAYLDQAQTLARETGDQLAALNAAMLAGNAQFALGRLARARACFERYVLLGQELGLPDEAACATLNLAQVAFVQGCFQEAWDRARSGAAAAGAIGNRVYEAFGLAYAGLVGCHLGQLAEAEKALVEAEAIAASLGGYMQAQVDVLRLETLIFLGRLGRAEELGLELAGREELKAGELAGMLAMLMGQLYELAGELEVSVDHVRKARRTADALGNAVLRAQCDLGLAAIALRAGQLAVAEQRAAEALVMAEDSGAQLVALRAHVLLARVRWMLGRPTEAAEHVEACEPLARSLASPHWQGVVWSVSSRFMADGVALRHKAAAFFQFYLNQLPPLARQDFLRWPDRRDALGGRGTNVLDPLVPRAASGGARREADR